MREPIAIVGLGCRFPGAGSPAAFWRMLRDGVHGISEVPPDRWHIEDYYQEEPAAPGKMTTRWGGFLDRVFDFDPAFFGISPREAIHMDPQQRLVLEVSWEALEDGGFAPKELSGEPVGVFLGISSYDYGGAQLNQPQRIVDGYLNTGGALSIAANRVSYFFDFRGPSMAVDTACSSSLVATHLACQSLWCGESTLALAGGVNVILSPAVTIGFSKLKALAPDGRCKTFDARADGYVRGEGAGMVVLKPLARALADGDRIVAVIRASEINQDGRTNGLTAPNGLSQRALLRRALVQARVTPSQIGYVEAHGTGTSLGDPIELDALGAVLAEGRDPALPPCAVGSVKTNLGHLEAAAGIASLIKVALSLEKLEIPRSLHFEKPNPLIPFDKLPLRVQRHHSAWPSELRPAIASVSAFGFGGTNVHVVLEEPPRGRPPETRAEGDTSRARVLLPLSAQGEGALKDLAKAYRELLDIEPEVATAPSSAGRLLDLAYNASVRRSHHDHRLAVVAESLEDLKSKLDGYLEGVPLVGSASGRMIPGRESGIVFVFPGRGSQWPGMGRDLLEREPVFRDSLVRFEEAMRPHVHWSLLRELDADEGESCLDRVDVVQPTLCAVQIALASLWRSWGVEPDAVVGHGMGEVAAAFVAGALSLEDAARVVCVRSKLLKRMSGRGAMAVVELSVEQCRDALKDFESRVSVAECNSATSTVLSGESAAVEEIVRRLSSGGVFCRLVNVDYASHSPQMDALMEPLIDALSGIRPKPASLPLYSTLTGTVAAGPELDAVYWARSLREPVRFATAILAMREAGFSRFVELSAHPILLPSIRQDLDQGGPEPEATLIPSLRQGESGVAVMLDGLGALYADGCEIDWRKLYPSPRRQVSLPSYPWQRSRFALEDAEGGRLDWRALVNAARESSRNPPRDLDFSHHAAAAGLLERFTTACIARALRELGAFTTRNERRSLDGLGRELSIAPHHHPLLMLWIRRLEEHGLLRSEGADVVSPSPLPLADLEGSWDELRSKLPESPGFLDFLKHCGDRLVEVIRDEVNPLDLLFRGGSLETADELFEHAATARYFNGIASAAVASAASSSWGRPLRILEVGSGAGGTTASLLPVLPRETAVYDLTEVTPFFLDQARRKFAQYGFVRYGLLDLERSLGEQDYLPASYDVVVAGNVLHVTRSPRQALSNVRSLIAPGGFLVLLETTRHQPWFEISFGFLWQGGVEEWKSGHPLLTREEWTKELEASGFESVVSLPDAGADSDILGQHVILARAAARADEEPRRAGPRGEISADPASSTSAEEGEPFYEIRWVRTSTSEAKAPAPEDARSGGRWLLFADAGGVANALSDLLVRRGDIPILVSRGERYRRLGEDHFCVRAREREDMERLLEEVLEGSRTLRAVVHLWSLDCGPPAEISTTGLDRALALGCVSVVHWIQAAARREWSEPPRSWLVTDPVHLIEEDAPGTVAVAQAPLWGLARALSQEHPAFWGGMVALDGLTPRASAMRLVGHVTSQDSEDQVALREEGTYAPRLARLEAPVEVPLSIRRDGSYLITGGLGDLGLLVARWLVERGAPRLILLGRTRLPPRSSWDRIDPASRQHAQIAAIRSLEVEGARIEVVSADVSDEPRMRKLLARWDRRGEKPIRGVIHAAGWAEARTLLTLDDETLTETVRAKVAGAWVLHRLFRDRPLDAFVLFSSAASLLGFLAQGLGHYAAANAFLDALAHHRRSLGLPALSINWGPWGGVGMAARAGLLPRLEPYGIRSLAPDRGVGLLGRLLGLPHAQVAAMDIDWRQMSRAAPTVRRSALLSELFREGGGEDQDLDSGPADPLSAEAVLAAEPSERRRLMESALRGRIAAVLGLPASQLDVHQPLTRLGLDSLMGLELQSIVESELSVTVSLIQLLTNASVATLSEHLVEKIAAEKGATAAEIAGGDDAKPAGDNESLLMGILALRDEEGS